MISRGRNLPNGPTGGLRRERAANQTILSATTGKSNSQLAKIARNQADKHSV
jgi:hypothetical protein